MHESDIMHENGPYWVGRIPGSYTVYKMVQSVGSVPDSSYERNADGLSIAIARADYLAKRDLARSRA